MDFADPVKDAKSVAGFSPCRKFVSKWRPPKSIFQDELLKDSRHFRD